MTNYKTLSAFEQVELQKQVEELQARIAMQDEVISGTVRVCEAQEVRRATSEDVAAWQEKQLAPLKREVAMLRNAEPCPDCDNVGYYYPESNGGEAEQCEFCYTNPKSVFNAECNTQATAEAYEKEVAAKALEDAAEHFTDDGTPASDQVAHELRSMAAELRGEKK